MKRKPRSKFKIFTGFRLHPEIHLWLGNEAERLGKTKTRLLEEALRVRMARKVIAQ